ncbi:MAG: 6-bladed beta-propeller [Bacteroidales bacterium]|nr:6-bladed beta-propeller [Bacteroidales bacterium]
MKLNNIYILIACLLTSVHAQNCRVNIDVISTIGEHDFYFTYPLKVLVDSDNSIFVVDKNATELFKFNSKGEFVKKIGNQGKGPSEFLEVTNIVFQGNNIIAFDRTQQRFTIFNDNGILVKTINTPQKLMMNPLFIDKLTNESFFIYDPTSVEKSNLVFYEISSDLKNIQYFFGNAESIFDLSTPFGRSLKSVENLDVCILSSTKIIISQRFYNGKILLMEKITGGWKYTERNGFKPNIPAYQEYSLKELNTLKENKINFMVLSENKSQFLVAMNCISSGIFTFKNKYVLHFFCLTNKKKTSDLYLNIFDYNGQLISSELVMQNKPLYDFRVLGKDNNEYFIVRDLIDGIPVLQKLRISINL